MIRDSIPVSRLARILVVDDDAALSKGLTNALSSQGYVVRALSRGAQVLETAAHFRPDLVVLDVMMPEVDGWEVLRRLRANVATASTPVIMLTAKDSEEAKVTGFTLGADDYVTKPFSLQELRCRVAAVLKRASEPADDDAEHSISVLIGSSGFGLVRVRDVYYVEGVHNYSYVHTYDSRFLTRLSLGALAEQGLKPLVRVHRSFIVNMDHVRGCGWRSKSSYGLRLADLTGTEVPVSRAQVADVQRLLGLRR